MRRAGFASAASLLVAVVAAAQQPAPPAQPQSAPNQELQQHLNGWQQSMGGLVNFGAKFDLTKTDNVFKKDTFYEGSVLCMKPSLAILRIESKNNKADYEAFICDGKSVFHYDGNKKAVTQFKLNPGANADNVMIDFIGGMNAAAAQARFDITLFQVQQPNYVYLDIKPKLGKDMQEFTQARMCLLLPGNVAKLPGYLPVQVWMAKPNNDTELWKLRDHAVNDNRVNAGMFQYQPIPGWPLQQAGPPAPAPGAPPGLPPIAPKR